MNKKILLTELIVGALGVVFVLFFGVKGAAVIALYAISVFFRNKRVENIEEKLLFHKTNSITFAVVLLLLFLLFFIQDYSLITNASLCVKDVWIYLTFVFTLFVHGVIGLIMFKAKKK
jgi:hypothetical protein